MFINDDGLQIIDEDERRARIEFYADHSIGWTARPKHGKDGFVRKGKFKKVKSSSSFTCYPTGLILEFNGAPRVVYIGAYYRVWASPSCSGRTSCRSVVTFGPLPSSNWANIVLLGVKHELRSYDIVQGRREAASD